MISPWRLWRLLLMLPRPVVPLAYRVRDAEDVQLFARALSAPETAWVAEAASIGSGWTSRLLSLSLRQEDGSPMFARESEVGCLDENDLGGLVNAVQEALAIMSPTRLTADRNAWHVVLCEGAKHPANWQDAYALGGCVDVSFGFGKGAIHITDHPEWWYGVPQREMIDGHWMAFRAAVAVRIETDRKG